MFWLWVCPLFVVLFLVAPYFGLFSYDICPFWGICTGSGYWLDTYVISICCLLSR